MARRHRNQAGYQNRNLAQTAAQLYVTMVNAQPKGFSCRPTSNFVDILALLVERFGAGRTLGEVYATSYALKVLRERGNLSVADIAKATDSPKQSLSWWLQHHVDTGQIETQPTEDDARRKRITITDPTWTFSSKFARAWWEENRGYWHVRTCYRPRE